MINRIFKYSIKNILRNKFLSFSSIIVLTLLMFFINILVVLHDVSINLIDGINSKLTISLYLDDKYDRNTTEVIELIEDIKKIEGGIQVQYQTKDEILETIGEKEPDLAKILERTNPLPNTIVLSNIGLEQYQKLNMIIENKLYILSKANSDREHFSDYTSQYKKIEQVIGILYILQLGLYIIIVIFSVSIAVIIYSVIGNFIYYFRDEIYITQLVGGSKVFINGPFTLQGAIYSFVAFLLSIISFLFIIQTINKELENLYFLNISYNIFLIEGISFIVIGGLSGLLSSRRYLK